MQMTINIHTRISRLLEYDRDGVIQVLTELNAKFARLKNPLLRRLLVNRVSIADACRISNTPVADFMRSMEEIGFCIDGKVSPEAQAGLPEVSLGFTEPLDYLEIDVRPILANGKDPLKEILASVKLLEEGQGLKLLNTFEPTPLIRLLAGKGFNWRVDRVAPDLVVTCFYSAEKLGGRVVIAEPAAITDEQLFDRALAGFRTDKLKYIDVRELQMPGPMLAILEQTPGITDGGALFVYHKKIPVYLLPELEKQGLSYIFKAKGPGDVHMLIYKK
jgi:uncharacterized protein (DUF2249 family)